MSLSDEEIRRRLQEWADATDSTVGIQPESDSHWLVYSSYHYINSNPQHRELISLQVEDRTDFDWRMGLVLGLLNFLIIAIILNCLLISKYIFLAVFAW